MSGAGTVDVAVIGAGPAGLAAGARAARLGLDTLVLDEQSAPGGQVHRNVDQVLARHPARAALLGEDYRAGGDLTTAFRASGARLGTGTSVWEISRFGPDGRPLPGGAGHTLGTLADGRAGFVRARAVIIANGAMERPVPVPGATLPGVMTAGAAQTLLKASGLVPDVPVALVGSGPLVYLVARQLMRAGTPIAGLWLTTPPARRWQALPELPAFWLAGDYLAKGIAWRRELLAGGVTIREGVRDVQVEGGDRVETVSATGGDGVRRLEAGLVLLHEGVVPNTQLTRALECRHVWDVATAAFRPHTDVWGETSVRSVWAAGDGAGVAGALAAVPAGELAALGAAHRLGVIGDRDRERLAIPARNAHARHLAARPFLDRLFRPADWVLRPTAPDAVICRCEEIRLADLDPILAEGCPGPNQAKAFTRCGMGPCQGRMCGALVNQLFAAHHGVDPESAGYYRIRPPIRPLTVGELAALGRD